MTAGWDTDTFRNDIQFMKSTEIAGIPDRQQSVRDAEAPGLRLMNFLSTHQTEIMAREKDNER